MKMHLPIAPMAIKVRLAAWYFVIMTIAMSAMGALALAGMKHSIRGTVNEQLADRVKLIRKIMLALPTEVTRERLMAQLRENIDPESQEQLVQISDERGSIVFQSNWLQSHSLASVTRSDRAQKRHRSGYDLRIDGEPFHGIIENVTVGSHVYSVQVAQNMDDFYDAALRFRSLLFAIVPALILGASLGGYWIGGRALAPVDEITRAAQEISSRNLSTRLVVPRTRDELARLSETLNAMLERIDLGLKQVAQFTADASHELRTPIALMRTRAELSLRRPRSVAEYQETIEQLHSEIVRTSDLVERLMLMARADSGASLLRIEPVELAALVRTVSAQTSVLAEQKQLQMDASLGDGECWVLGDVQYLRQLFVILIDNAVKYTPAPGKISVTLAKRDEYAQVSVSDSGIGIDADDLGNVFERFYRADKARSRETGGAGLGLSIGRWIAESHGGTIKAESKSGAGSTFVVELPLER